MRFLLPVAVVVSVLLAIAACSALSEHRQLGLLGINTAVAKTIERAGSPEKRTELAAHVLIVTQDVRAYLARGSLTLSELRIYASAQADQRSLDPSQRALLSRVVAVIEEELQRVIPDVRELSDEDRALVDQALDAAEAAARAYLPGAA